MRRALAVWLDHAHSGNEGVTVMAPLHTSVPLGTFIENMSSLELALLSLLMRHGALSTEFLAQQLQEPTDKIRRLLSNLESCRIVSQSETNESQSVVPYFEVRDPMRDPMAHVLRRLHIWSDR